MVEQKIGRNDPCPCGSGKKYKKCCESAAKPAVQTVSPAVLAQLQQAVSLHQNGQYLQAQALYRNVLAEVPDQVDALHYLGVLHYQTGDSASGVELIQRAAAIKPTATMHNNLGAALQAQYRHEEALASYRAAIAANPKYAEAFNNAGAALQELGRLNEAVEYFQRALQLLPAYAGAENNLANTLMLQGDLAGAIQHYRRSLALDDNNLSTRSNLLMALSYFPPCSAADYLQEAKRYGEKVAAKARPYKEWAVGLPGSPLQKLRIGLVSADFKTHPVGYFLESVLRHIDPERLELVAYAAQRAEDGLTDRIKPYFYQWRNIAGMADEAVAGQIYRDQVHVLVDLSGHTAGNRLAVFAWKPAPVQVSWLGYFASTGVAEIDYLLTDAVSSPAAMAPYFSERFHYLPDTRLCFSEPETAQPLTGLPAAANGYVTFGCFQNLTKINDDVIRAWGRIFQALPDARLIIRNKQMSCPDAAQGLAERLAAAGIGADRVQIGGLLPRVDYLAAYGEIDIGLDTFPYPGGTTTCESLWMGVPVLTLAGETLLSRQGASLLHCVGLNDWIAEDADDYAAKAVRHAQDAAGLAALRQQLRPQIRATSLMDAKKFCRQLEQAFFDIWNGVGRKA